jgi:hypothetical protein
MNKLWFNQNFQNKTFNIEFLNKKNFYLFRITNFLDENSYDFINKSFPKIDNKKLANFDLEKNNYKYTIMSTDENYKEMIEKDERMQTIHSAIFSNFFFNYFYENLKIELLKSRTDDLKFFLKLLKPKTLHLNQGYLKNFFYTYIRRHIEYSYIFNGGKIVPHTDGRKKLLSLLLFFPEGREGEKDIGTTFWDSNKKNLNNKHLRDSQKENEFKKNNKVMTKIDFNKYDLYGFIRTAKSWHSVEPFDLGKDYVRKSLNINFYFF